MKQVSPKIWVLWKLEALPRWRNTIPPIGRERTIPFFITPAYPLAAKESSTCSILLTFDPIGLVCLFTVSAPTFATEQSICQLILWTISCHIILQLFCWKLGGFLNLYPNENVWQSVLDTQSGHTSFSWFLSPNSPKLCHTLLLSALSSYYSHGCIKDKYLPAQRYLCFHILLYDLPLSDLCCWNPLSSKTRDVSMTFKAYIGKAYRKGSEGPCWVSAWPQITTEGNAMGRWPSHRPRGSPIGMTPLETQVHSSVPSVFRQDTRQMETEFQVKGVDRTPFSDLWSRPGLSKLYKELFLAKFLISHMCEMETSLCQKYTPPPPPQLCL